MSNDYQMSMEIPSGIPSGMLLLWRICSIRIVLKVTPRSTVSKAVILAKVVCAWDGLSCWYSRLIFSICLICISLLILSQVLWSTPVCHDGLAVSVVAFQPGSRCFSSRWQLYCSISPQNNSFLRTSPILSNWCRSSQLYFSCCIVSSWNMVPSVEFIVAPSVEYKSTLWCHLLSISVHKSWTFC